MNGFNTYLQHIDRNILRDYILAHGRKRVFRRGEAFLTEGCPCPDMCYVQAGVFSFTTFNAAEGRSYSVGFAFPDEFVADYPACLYGGPALVGARALTRAEVCVCPAAPFWQILDKAPALHGQDRLIAEQLFLQTFRRYLNLYRLTPEERYLQLLADHPGLLQLVPLKEIASYLRITPTHLSRLRKRINKR